MFLNVDYNSGEPISHQIVAQLKLMVVSGRLQGGDRLPSIRDMARTLKINPTTVTRIYNELANEGVVTLRHGQGVFVCDRIMPLKAEEVRRIVSDKARGMLVEGLRLGLNKEQIEQVVDEEFRRIRMGDHE
jgi:GntR family transcriptional regulator